jgi:hypothetical protein
LLSAMNSDAALRARILGIDSNAIENLENRRNVRGCEWNHKTDGGNTLDLLPAAYHAELTSTDPGRIGGFAQSRGPR